MHTMDTPSPPQLEGEMEASYFGKAGTKEKKANKKKPSIPFPPSLPPFPALSFDSCRSITS